MLKDKLSPLLYLANNWISKIGVFLVTTAGILWLFLLPTFLGGHAGSAYVGILLFVMIPMAFFAGLALIPLGIALRRRKGAPLAESLPPLSWQNPDLRKLMAFVGAVSVANVIIGSNLTYRAMEHMESVEFCGATCHTVMKPEYTAYKVSAHSRVECVKCHIGPGASWFVQSKLSGAHQVIAVALNNFERPIPTPVRNLRPARDTCEGCHWPDKYGSDRLRVITHFDDKGEESKSVLLMRIGGGGLTGGGIHTAHVGQGVSIRYRHSDEQRQTIPWVEYSRDGKARLFQNAKVKAEEIEKMPLRQMDCVDCHNRPSHTFELPERALDASMAARRIKPDLPEIRKKALDVLKKEYATTAQAESEIPAEIEKAYASQNREQDVTEAAREVLAIWQRNVFPEMKIKWGTYPINIGHNDFPGCFRCHDDDHKDGAGKAIGQDCNACHQLLAMEEKSPKILTDLGVSQ